MKTLRGSEENKRLTQETRNHLHNRLVVLGDMLSERCDEAGSSFYKQVEREYKQIINKLYPKPRKKTKQRILICENCGASKKKRIQITVERITVNCFCGHQTIMKIKE